ANRAFRLAAWRPRLSAKGDGSRRAAEQSIHHEAIVRIDQVQSPRVKLGRLAPIQTATSRDWDVAARRGRQKQLLQRWTGGLLDAPPSLEQLAETSFGVLDRLAAHRTAPRIDF